MGEQFNNATSMKELCKGGKRCCRSVRWKSAPVDWENQDLARSKRLRDDILSGRYKMQPGTEVIITHPKPRTALAINFRDRVWHNSMCENGVYNDITHDLIYDCPACRKGFGTEHTIRRTITFLQKLYREDGSNAGWGAHIDVKKYFPSTPKSLVVAQNTRKVSEKLFLPYLNEVEMSSKDKRSVEEIASDPFGQRGTGLGSPINQINQVALLDNIDKLCKRLCKYYIRYNDDFLILDKSKAKVKFVCGLIKSELARLGFGFTDKHGLFPISQFFAFLKIRFKVTKTGKVITKLTDENLQNERKQLRNLKRLLDCGKRTMQNVCENYQSWIAYAEMCSSDVSIRTMDRFYTNLFRVKPAYKRSSRRSRMFSKKAIILKGA